MISHSPLTSTKNMFMVSVVCTKMGHNNIENIDWKQCSYLLSFLSDKDLVTKCIYSHADWQW